MTEHLEQPDEQAAEPETFTREYVHQLREEARANRERADEASNVAVESKQTGDRLWQQLRTQTVRAGASDLLRDVADLDVPDDALIDENGFLSVDKVREAALALIEAKPYLARPQGGGNPLAQGAKEQPTPKPGLIDFLQAAVH